MDAIQLRIKPQTDIGDAPVTKCAPQKTPKRRTNPCKSRTGRMAPADVIENAQIAAKEYRHVGDKVYKKGE